MAMIPLMTDEKQKETIIFRSDMLPYGLYMPGPKGCFYGDIPWHWHDEFEFGYLTGGSMIYKTQLHEYVLHEGDGIFINSGTLHYLHPLEPCENVQLQSQFFDKSFLAGAAGSVFDLKYITPVQEQRRFDAFPLYRKDSGSRTFLDRLGDAAAISRQGENFYELRLRSLFSELWESVYTWAASCQSEKPLYDPSDNDRIKKILQFMQQHYSEHLEVRAIAAHIPVSERECYRLFKNCLGMSPMEYLTTLRLAKARELLMSTQKNILEIAVETGFGNSSYFGKLFKQQHHMTPKQYRSFAVKGAANR